MSFHCLTTNEIMDRSERLFGEIEVATRSAEGGFIASNYQSVMLRARRLAMALRKLGVRKGERVGTFCGNHTRHLEAYFGIPAAGAVLHTLNIRLFAKDLIYIIRHAEDRCILVDEELWSTFEPLKRKCRLRNIIIIPREENGGSKAGWTRIPGTLDYEELLASAPTYEPRLIKESEPAGLCYTSGTTGRPKGVIYSHRHVALHSLISSLPDCLGLSSQDRVLPVVPLFHANGWGLPFSAALNGASQFFLGHHAQPLTILDTIRKREITVAAAVPTVWMEIMRLLEKNPRWDLRSLRLILIGGSAVPEALIRFYHARGVSIVQGWGLTETIIGTLSQPPRAIRKQPLEDQLKFRAKAGRPVPFFQIRVKAKNGLAPWDGRTMGEIEVRGPCVIGSYFKSRNRRQFTSDGWFRTGDIGTMDAMGCLEIRDRSKDLIKSGGEWISSVALENALMGHPSVAEAAAIAVPHPKWMERPLVVVVLKNGMSASREELIEFLRPRFAKWWIPDAVEFLSAIPHTSTGKISKLQLREKYTNFSSWNSTPVAPSSPIACSNPVTTHSASLLQ